MLDTFKDMWDAREPREQVLLVIMGLLLGVFILWQFILTPVFDGKQKAETERIRAERDYAAVARALPGLDTPTTRNGQNFSQAVFLEAARKRGLNPSRVQPDGNQNLSIWIDVQDTSALYGLLNDVITQNGANLTRATISTGANQMLTAQLTFSLSP